MFKLRTSIFMLLAILLFGVAAQAQEEFTITIRCIANVDGGEGWRCDNFAVAEEEVEELLGVELNLNLIQDSAPWADYKNEFLLAAQSGEAPDIILSGHEDVGAWAPAGFIVPMEALIGDVCDLTVGAVTCDE
ncbi:MAG: extracellular solute-binding protein, partial [Chloroflexi bacterium]|nr:extracellular solute-binding protein [Chloroflexota bacterium]